MLRIYYSAKTSCKTSFRNCIKRNLILGGVENENRRDE
jgi:hypothetical protein